MTVRVRYAGAPSGDIHVGNARTALFNWLFARHEGGVFVHRVEDTDPEKAKPELIARIYETLDWLGLDRDEGPDVGGPHEPYRQSQRGDYYAQVIERLVRTDAVYRCYCTRDEIKARGTATGYDRYCRTLTEADRMRFESEGRSFALRFRTPETDVVVRDLLRGDVTTPRDEMQDFIVARADGSATFVLANTADDVAMEITHVIRATDLLPAAAQNTLVFEALGAEPPKYAHVPLVLGPDKARLGARHGAVGTLSYRDAGYLSEAFVNYLALLGWSSPTGDELLSRERLVEEFTLDRVLASGAVFDKDKLTWMNQEYLQRLSRDEFQRRVLELGPDTPREALRKTLELDLLQTRVKTLAEVPGAISYLAERPAIDPDAAKKWLRTEESDKTLQAVADVLETVEPWTPDAVREAIQEVIEDLGLHRRRGPKPIFVAISGSEVALPIFQSIWIIGREEAVARLRAAIA